jgi:endo-1,4-beta-xylanase
MCVILVNVGISGLAAWTLAGCTAGVEEGYTATGGTAAVGGAPGSGGARSGGASGSGGSHLGGAPGTGGAALGSGGRTNGSGGALGTGGSVASGGRGTGGGSGGPIGSGGRVSTGGATASGGRGTGGGNGSGTGGSSTTCSGAPLTGGTQHCSSNMSGNLSGGYAYTIWSSGSGGCITPYGVGAAFKATWNNSGDFLARSGLQLTSNKTFDQYGTIAADFSETKTGTAGGYSYIGIYGWSVNPLHEYYIIDDWFGSRPNPGTKVGSVTIDGGTYDILTHTQTNQPAITGGNQTFEQFWSLRTSGRSCGHISISEHFKAWKAAGLTLGNMEEVKVLIEAGGGMGSIDFNAATVTAQ